MMTKIFNLIILDESGSMRSIKKDAIDSVNETIQTILKAQQDNEEQEHFVTFVTFNDEVKTICDCVPCNELKEITDADYSPACCTALYDAMGNSLTNLCSKVGESDKVLVTIVTDGYENSSKEYNGAAIKALVEELKGKGWIFAYIGANHDVESFAARISITNTWSFNATSMGVKAMNTRLNRSRTKLYSSMTDEYFDADEANIAFFKDE